MVKRIYSESVKKWLIASGIAVPSMIIGIFVYLTMVGGITPTGQNGDTFCAGTFEDPCYAYMNFTANEDIFIYPTNYDPWGRNTPFLFEPGLKDWKLQRSWGDGWRDIPLNETCKGTWCGGKYGVTDNAYSYAFRKGKDYSIRIIAYKTNPFQNVYWQGFDGLFDPWWNSSWTKCKNITINNPGSSTLTDFPIFLTITYDSDMQSDFDDLRFTDEPCNVGGNLLFAELEDKTDSSTAEVWIKHTLPAAGDIISVYYGNTVASSNWDTSGNVWQSNYKLVSHLNITADSTSNNNDGSATGATSSSSCLFGNCYEFDGDSDYIDYGNDASLDFVADTNDWSMSVWVNSDDASNQNYISFRDTNWGIGTQGGTLFFQKRAGSFELIATNNSLQALNNKWTNYVITYDDSEGADRFKFYVNGTFKPHTTDNEFAFDGTDNNLWGSRNSVTSAWDGHIDELRFINNTVLTADWINVSFQLLANPDSFITFSGEETQQPQTTDNFYFSNSGNDLNSCNITAPCKTIAKYNTLTIYPGDHVYFNKSDTWYLGEDAFPVVVEGNSTDRVTYTAFGTGDRPKFIGGKRTNFTVNTTNIYVTTATSSLDVGHVTCNNHNIVGRIKQSTYGAVNSEGDFYYDPTTDLTYVYTSTNLTATYTNCHLAQKDNIFDIQNKEYVNFDGLYLADTGQHGIAGSGADYILINDTDLWNIGGSYQSGTTRYGNAIEFGLSSTNVVVSNNKIYNVYDAGITWQCWSGTLCSIEDHYWHNNLIVNTTYGIETFTGTNTGSHVWNFSFDQNTVIYTGGGFGLLDGHTTAIGWRLSESNNVRNFTLTNNINGNETNRAIVLGSFDDDFNGQLTIDYTWFTDGASNAHFVNWNGTDYNSYAAWQTVSNQNLNGADEIIEYVNTTLFQPVGKQSLCTGSSTGSYVGYVPCSTVPDTTNPGITFNSPVNDSTYGNQLNVTLSVTCYDDIKVHNISIYVNGTLNVTNTTPINNTAWVYNLTVTNYTTYTMYMTCFDNSSNSNTTETRYYTFEISNADINISYGTNISGMYFYPSIDNINYTTFTLTELNDEVENQTSSNPYIVICNSGTGSGTLKASLNDTSSTHVVKCGTVYDNTLATNLSTSNSTINSSIGVGDCNNVYCWMDWLNASQSFYFIDTWDIS